MVNRCFDLSTYVLQVRNGNVKQILEFLRDTEEFNNTFRLLTKMSIEIQCLFGVHVGHLEVVF